jgi:hypothetical protein
VCSRWICGVFVWDSWGSECAAGGFVLCVCVGVGQLWSECAADGFVLCVCVCGTVGGVSVQRGGAWCGGGGGGGG